MQTFLDGVPLAKEKMLAARAGTNTNVNRRPRTGRSRVRSGADVYR
jgi:hypothetical protein